MFIFSIGGTTYGMCEETVPFYLLLAATMVAAGFDSVVGAAVVLLGAGCGVLGSTVNPFAVGAAVDSLSRYRHSSSTRASSSRSARSCGSSRWPFPSCS